MRTTFSGIELARRALQAQQRSLDVVGHNVANANNPGYSRQVAVHSAATPYPFPDFNHGGTVGMIGTGVEVSEIARMRNSFVEMRLRQENQIAQYWTALSDGLTQVELIFNEPSENGIYQSLELFWNSLQELEPENEATRSVVIQQAEVLAGNIRHNRSQLGKLRDNMNLEINVKVEEINSIADRIASLNGQIVKVTATGMAPNDLLDSRDLLLQELSQLVNMEAVEDQFGSVTVSVGGATLVQRTQTFKIEVVQDEDKVIPEYDKQKVVWEGLGTKVDISGGELHGIMTFRDHEVQSLIEKLNDWTSNLINTINDIHEKGFDLNNDQGKPMFVIGTGKSDGITRDDDPSLSITVNLKEPSELAASAIQIDGKTVVGNNDIALELAALRNKKVLNDNTVSIGDGYNSIISELGVRSQRAKVMVENEEVLVNHLSNLQAATSGVNLDEEMADLIKFQHAYAAAARVMTAMDENLDIIINRLGTFGR